MKIIISAVYKLLLMTVSLLTAYLPCQAAAGPIKVGVILPLTGSAASFGVGVKNGIDLAYGELAPAEKAKLKIYYEDDGFSPKNSISAFNRLRELYQIDVVVNAGSQTSKALSPLAEKAKIPLIAIASDPEVVAGKSYVVNFWVTPAQEIEALLPYAAKLGYKKVARISTVHDFPLAIKKAFDQGNQGQLEVVLDEEYPGEVRDFKTYIARLKAASGVDAVALILMPGHAGLFAKQLRQMGSQLPMFGFEFFEDPEEVKNSEGALVGQWYVSAADAGQAFATDYFKAFPGEPIFGAPNGYDIVLMLAAVPPQAMSPAALNDYLHTLKDFTGSMGTYSASGQNTYTLPAAVKVVTKTGFEQLSQPN